MIKALNQNGIPANPKINVASESDRAEIASNAIQGPAAVSDTGHTAVGSTGIGGGIKNLLGKAAGFASKFLPGPWGAVAKIASNALNDPEWWQSVRGESLTLNDPLRVIDTEIPAAVSANFKPKRTIYPRFAIAEFLSYHEPILDSTKYYAKVEPVVMKVTDNMVTQYLMPQIRSVVNAITLQDATAYGTVLSTQAAIYAIYKQLLKFDYMLKHGNTYIASFNDTSFPVLRVENASWLQATINRLEEYLRASVRLPHTLCEYISWRFGRVYRTNDSAKAGIVLYNVLPINGDTTLYDAAIQILMDKISATASMQQANTDLFNAYKNHENKCDIKDDTQFAYDRKEFALRCNLTGCISADIGGTIPLDIKAGELTDWAAGKLKVGCPATPVIIDSSLDNPTVFMASTVSAMGVERGSLDLEVLFPVDYAMQAWIPSKWSDGTATNVSGPRIIDAKYNTTEQEIQYVGSPFKFFYGNDATIGVKSDGITRKFITVSGSNWGQRVLLLDHIIGWDQITAGSGRSLAADALSYMAAAKSLDLYNLGLFALVGGDDISEDEEPVAGDLSVVDITTLSIDEGQPSLTTIETEHIYAFANLVDVDRKSSESYKQAEKEVAKELANEIEKIDVVTVK